MLLNPKSPFSKRDSSFHSMKNWRSLSLLLHLLVSSEVTFIVWVNNQNELPNDLRLRILENEKFQEMLCADIA